MLNQHLCCICATTSLLLASATAKAETLEPEPNPVQPIEHIFSPDAIDNMPEHEGGIWAGNFILSPGATFFIGYNSLGAEDDVNSKGDGFIDIGIQLNTKLRDEDTHTWNNELHLHWEQFFGLGDESPSGKPMVLLISEADLFKENFLRVSPGLSYSYLGGHEHDEFQMDHDHHAMRLGSALTLQPKQRENFSQRFAYFFNGKIYEEFSGLSFFDHRFDTVTQWIFFPELSTALTLDFRYIHYLESERPASEDSISTQQDNHNAMPFRATFSLGGTVFERFSYEIGAGYSYAYYGKNAKSHLFIAHASFECALTEETRIFIEYRKDHDSSLYGDFYHFHRTNFGFDALWFERLQTSASFGAGYLTFQSGSTAIRKDLFLAVQAGINYSFMPGLQLGVQYALYHNTSDVSIAEYTKHVVSLNFSYAY
ncbi:MAG: hypothetical protein FWC40_01280 [Proteobacteria bacterium]|nr:hypothetical protein [Pseudomonadota bacterium]